MTHDPKLFRLVEHELSVRRAVVQTVTRLAPRMVRIAFADPDLQSLVTLSPEDHVKLLFARPGAASPALSWDDDPIDRDYTPRRFDARTGVLEIDFVLHEGHGVAGAWAASAKPGDALGVAGPRASFVLEETFLEQVFIGDETALPEFARRIEELPQATRARLVLVVDDARAESLLEARPSVAVRWVHRAAPDADASPALLDAVRALELPRPSCFVWIAGEASEVKKVYRYLTRERRVARSHVHASGHWKRGAVAHDHHEPIDD